MIGGNRAILNASQKGRALRVFEGTGGVVEYKGLFNLDQERPWYEADAPETGHGPIRSVIVFRLRPADTAPAPPSGVSVVPGTCVVTSVAVEDMHTEKAVVDPSREPYEAERRESKLVQRFKRYMESKGQLVERLMITPSGEAKPILTDLYLNPLNILVEAKGGIDRCSIRMALGQLIDYSRFAPPNARLAVLLPSIPRDDLRKLLAHAGVCLFFPERTKFVLVDRDGHRVPV